MIITKRSDYALRVCRALKDGKTHSVREICEKEDIPKAFAYKIIRELEQSGIVITKWRHEREWEEDTDIGQLWEGIPQSGSLGN